MDITGKLPAELDEVLKYARLIDKIEAWSKQECNKWFKMDFVNSVKTNLIQYQRITQKQMDALNNIASKCKIV